MPEDGRRPEGANGRSLPTSAAKGSMRYHACHDQGCRRPKPHPCHDGGCQVNGAGAPGGLAGYPWTLDRLP